VTRVSPPISTLSILAAVALGGIACSPMGPRAARKAVIQEELLRANAAWLDLDPDTVAVKFATMAADPYDFMRGSTRLFYVDMAEATLDRERTAAVSTAAAASVHLVGDPHPENISFLKADEDTTGHKMVLEWVDLDASTFGPYLLDLRKLVQGAGVLTAPLEGCEDCIALVAEAAAEGYFEEIEALAEGEDRGQPGAGPLLRDELDGGELFDDLLDEALEEGPIHHKRNRYAAQDADGRWFFERTAAEDAFGSAYVSLTAREVAQTERLLAQYAQTEAAPAGFRVLDVARRLGMGVGSQPAVRYGVLWDTGPDTEVDMFTIRETRDPPPIPGSSALAEARWTHNAERVRSSAWVLWSHPAADPRHVALSDGDTHFKVLSWNSWFQDLDHLEVAEEWLEGDVDEDDLEDAIELCARVLARSHARAPLADGGDALAAIAADLDALGEDELADELVASGRRDLARNTRDHRLFRELLDEDGPLLGHTLVQGDLQ